MGFGRRDVPVSVLIGGVSQCGFWQEGCHSVEFGRRGVTVCVLVGGASQCAFW